MILVKVNKNNQLVFLRESDSEEGKSVSIDLNDPDKQRLSLKLTAVLTALQMVDLYDL